MSDDFSFGFAIGLAIALIFGAFSAKWYRRWSCLLDSVRLYLRFRGAEPQCERVISLTPFDLYKILEREREEGFELLPRRDQVQLTRIPRLPR